MGNENTGDKHLPAPTGMDHPDALPLLLLTDQVVFPMALVPLVISNAEEGLLINDVVKGHRLLALVAIRPGTEGKSVLSDAYDIGCIGRILQVQHGAQGRLEVVVQTLNRFRIGGMIRQAPYPIARIQSVEEVRGVPDEINPVMLTVKRQMGRLIHLSPTIPDSADMVLQNIDDPGYLADMIASNLSLSLEDKQKLLSILNVKERLERLMYMLEREINVLEISTRIHEEVKSSIDLGQREYFLRQQMRAIQRELGESTGAQSEAIEYSEKLEALDLPGEVRKEAQKEIDRLGRMNDSSAEYQVVATYLDTLIELPWRQYTADRLDLARAEQILDQDHSGLKKVKERILDYLAVRRLKPDAHGPILCFVGPPGVGKTSLGQSIARALDRKFVRMALGGMRDEAEIRGHRKTYVGALPGRIIQGLRKCGSANPVFMLDEIDKIGNDFRGDPSSALLEVLDPAQNHSFTDHYLNVPFDLSHVLFLATANMLEPIPWALRDRMEVIELPGYTLDEKLEIAKRYLAPRQIEANGLKPGKVTFAPGVLKKIVAGYTREAGVRNLEREIGHVCRGCARKFAGGRRSPIKIDLERLPDYLGKEKHFYDVAERTRIPGVVTGLAWTATGGDILFIEATSMPGKGDLILTGQLGDVMKESVRTALSYIQSNAERLGLDPAFLEKSNIHVHVPAGAVPKDGPSAGVGMLTAITSMLLRKKVLSNLAMTGEITLRGSVLPVGGIKEKVLAAARAGIRILILPDRNRNDLDDVPESVRKKLTVHFVSEMREVLAIALKVTMD
ncbi:MAG: endopeptidase La [Candidatus Hydrogenedentes bacterium]|nr:endopeptidase La [Candidatus Hydrogenedentota bacterium]